MLKYEVLLRLRAIELIAQWEGRLITNQLTAWFGISRQQASADINRYNRDINPDALVYEPAVKGYIPRPAFTPTLTSGHINEYMALLDSISNEPMAQVLEGYNTASVQLPNRAVRAEVVRAAITACRQQRQLSIHYASMAHPQPAQRSIAPHTLVYTGFRWHLRAWCYKREDFRDFSLSRIYRTPKLLGASDKTAEQDAAWQEQVELRLIPNQHLTPEQQKLVAHDFAMRQQRLVLTVRAALVQYTLQRYQAAITEDECLNTGFFLLQVHPDDQARISANLFTERARSPQNK
ncbi:MAG TPA: WYL domain-containing protein [Alcanivoracaceae bacterium]|nr:WYL domain-containing protein [Alcanivoracaceae bacterium]